jgi:Fructose-2,6-bisphosphatase
MLSSQVRRRQYQYYYHSASKAAAAAVVVASSSFLVFVNSGDDHDGSGSTTLTTKAGGTACTTSSKNNNTSSSSGGNSRSLPMTNFYFRNTHYSNKNDNGQCFQLQQPSLLAAAAVVAQEMILQTYQTRWGQGSKKEANVTSCESIVQQQQEDIHHDHILPHPAHDDTKEQISTSVNVENNKDQQQQYHDNDKCPPTNSTDPPHEPKPKETLLYNGLFPLYQLWTPKVPYPQWDKDWDGKQPQPQPTQDGNDKQDFNTQQQQQQQHQYNERFIRKHGITRHIILIRHGQYDERHPDDHKRVLTPLGRKQAELTGKRLAEMIQGINEQFGPCHVKVLRVSDMARAKETAEIIAKELPDWVERAEPDALLNEGRPCHTIPGGRVSQKVIEKTDQGHKRIEEAFRKYFYRADLPLCDKGEEEKKEEDVSNVDKREDRALTASDEKKDSWQGSSKELEFHPQHEFEIIVCHANVIRYFLCRALQLPPEAWLRLCTFNCSLNYITIRPTGSVSVRMLGDIGHLGYEYSTFSMHHGFNW